MDRVLAVLLRFVINRGNLRLMPPHGFTITLGDGTGKMVAARLTTSAAVRQIIFDPELGLGESYMDGTLVMEAGSIADLLALVLHQERKKMLPIWARPQWILRYLWRQVQQRNNRMRARHNVAHHYDLDDRLYSLFLDCRRSRRSAPIYCSAQRSRIDKLGPSDRPASVPAFS